MAYVQNVILQTGNGQNFLTWNLVAGASVYQVQRSLDQVNWSTVGSPTTPNYLDPLVAIGTQYYYQVGVGSSPTGYTASSPLGITPCAPGQINLGYLRYQSRLRADMLKSNFLTNDEWNILINQSAKRLFAQLVNSYDDQYFMAPPQVFQSSGLRFYPLPNGTNFLNVDGLPNPAGTPAPACYKVISLDVNSFGANINNPVGWVPCSRFMEVDRDKYNLVLGAASNNVTGQYCQFQYREMGTNLEILPNNNGQYFRLGYVPVMGEMLQDTDMMTYSYAGWHEWVVVDAASKAAEKRQFYDMATTLKNRRDELTQDIMTDAKNRDVGQPAVASNTRARMGDPNFGAFEGNGTGGYGSGGNSGGYGF
jgi:hypothetical protein